MPNSAFDFRHGDFADKAQHTSDETRNAFAGARNPLSPESFAHHVQGHSQDTASKFLPSFRIDEPLHEKASESERRAQQEESRSHERLTAHSLHHLDRSKLASLVAHAFQSGGTAFQQENEHQDSEVQRAFLDSGKEAVSASVKLSVAIPLAIAGTITNTANSAEFAVQNPDKAIHNAKQAFDRVSLKAQEFASEARRTFDQTKHYTEAVVRSSDYAKPFNDGVHWAKERADAFDKLPVYEKTKVTVDVATTAPLLEVGGELCLSEIAKQFIESANKLPAAKRSEFLSNSIEMLNVHLTKFDNLPSTIANFTESSEAQANFVPKNLSDQFEDFWHDLTGREPERNEPIAKHVEALCESMDSRTGKLIEELFEPVGTADLQHVTEIIKTLEHLPQQDLETIRNAGYKIFGSRTLEELLPHVAKRPIGYAPDYANDFANGITHGKKLVVPQFIKEGDPATGQFVPNAEYIAGTVRHEVSHALYEARGWVGTFAHNEYQHERAPLLAEKSPAAIATSRQEDQSLEMPDRFLYTGIGFKELTAELYAMSHGGCTLSEELQNLLRGKFPRTLRQLENMNWGRGK